MLGSITGLWSVPFPKSQKESLDSLVATIPAVLYYATPLRDWSNRKYFDDVTETLRRRLVGIAGLPDDQERFSWKKLRGIFFTLIDNDPSLTKKAGIAYSNGFIWTTVADIRALSLLSLIPSLVLYLCGFEGGLAAAIIIFFICSISFAVSAQVTKKHKAIGEEQLEIIEQRYAASLKNSLQNLP
jgi:hypothetical protein